MADDGAPRQERRKATTRAKLVDATRRVVADKGVEATTIAHITEAADVGFGTFYLHFGSKDAAIEAVVGELVEEVGTRARSAHRADAGPGRGARGQRAPRDRAGRPRRGVGVGGAAHRRDATSSSRPRSAAASCATSNAASTRAASIRRCIPVAPFAIGGIVEAGDARATRRPRRRRHAASRRRNRCCDCSA